jgi:hypothetical protein
MKLEIICRIIIVALILPAMLMLAACEDEEDNPVGDPGDLQEVTIIVVQNNTSTRVAGAHIVIDGSSVLSCNTSEPGGDTGGECTFLLKKIQHTIKITKAGYSPLESTFIVTGTMSTKYFSLSNK